MLLRHVTLAHRRLLNDLSGRISMRLESSFRDAREADGPNLGVMMSERGCSVVIEIPIAVLDGAAADAGRREALRVRLKGRRDRMMFRPPPPPLPKRIAPLSVYGTGQGGFQPRWGWGRRR